MTVPVTYGNKKNDGQNSDKGQWLLEKVYTPDLDTLEGLSRTALDRVQCNSFIRVYASETVRLCKISRKSQELYTANYKKWHSNDKDMGSVGMRIMPVDKPINEKQWRIDIMARKIVDYAKYRNDNKGNREGRIYSDEEIKGFADIVVDTSKNEKFQIPPLGTLPSIQYLYHHLMNRRSTIPDVLLETFGVTARVIETGNNENEDKQPRIMRSQ
jgi:hypothetical protein